MTYITKPMLAATYNDQVINFPVLATPKIDGIRALKINGVLLSRSFKSIPNNSIREHLESLLPDGADGEILCGDSLYTTNSAVMTIQGELPPSLVFYWFDWVSGSTDVPYYERVRLIKQHNLEHPSVIKLIPDTLHNMAELDEYKSEALLKTRNKDAFEGIMLRKPNGRYKCGRSTVSEMLLVKIKPYLDSEAIVIGTEPLMHNDNEPTLDNFGNIKRASRQQHMVTKDTLGSIIARTEEGVVFKIGTGYTQKARAHLWESRYDIVGKLVKYRHMGLNKIAPRSPVFLSIRHPYDTS